MHWQLKRPCRKNTGRDADDSKTHTTNRRGRLQVELGGLDQFQVVVDRVEIVVDRIFKEIMPLLPRGVFPATAFVPITPPPFVDLDLPETNNHSNGAIMDFDVLAHCPEFLRRYFVKKPFNFVKLIEI